MIDLRDPTAVHARRPFLVAHRGGVITPDSPENTLHAIKLAAQHGYAMVELDVMEARDGEPILMHGPLSTNCGVKRLIHDLASTELTALHYRASDHCVPTFAQAIEMCASLGLGVMLDKLRSDAPADSEMSAACLNRIASLIANAGLSRATVAICDTPRLREFLADVALFPVPPHGYERICAGQSVPLRGEFWFGWAEELPSHAVSKVQQNGALLIVSINTFHYPKHAQHSLAQADIDRLLAAGVEGFQIDDVYESCFGTRPKPGGCA